MFVVRLRDSTSVSDKYDKNETEVVFHPVFQHFIRPCFAEFLGCLIIAFGPLLIVAVSLAHVLCGTDELRALMTALAISGSTLSCMVSFGKLSGAHFNPTITLAVLLGGGMRFPLVMFFLLCQFSGAFIGSVLARCCVRLNTYATFNGGAPEISLLVTSKGQAILLLMLLACVLALVYLMTVTDSEGCNEAAPLSFCWFLFVAHLVSFPATGGVFNPTLAVGMALSAEVFAEYEWRYHYVYWVGPYMGVLVAALAYRLILAKTGKRLIFS